MYTRSAREMNRGRQLKIFSSASAKTGVTLKDAIDNTVKDAMDNTDAHAPQQDAMDNTEAHARQPDSFP